MSHRGKQRACLQECPMAQSFHSNQQLEHQIRLWWWTAQACTRISGSRDMKTYSHSHSQSPLSMITKSWKQPRSIDG